jgi:hypothetical protein
MEDMEVRKHAQRFCLICLFIYGLFNDAVSGLNLYIASIGGIISEELNGKDVEGLRKTTKYSNQNTRCTGRDSKRIPSEYY